MANFTQPINFIRSTISRAGKMYNSAGANRAKAAAWSMARSVQAHPMGAGVLLGGGAVAGGITPHRDSSGQTHRMRGAAVGALSVGGVMGIGHWMGTKRAGGGNLAGSAIRGLLR